MWYLGISDLFASLNILFVFETVSLVIQPRIRFGINLPILLPPPPAYLRLQASTTMPCCSLDELSAVPPPCLVSIASASLGPVVDVLPLWWLFPVSWIHCILPASVFDTYYTARSAAEGPVAGLTKDREEERLPQTWKAAGRGGWKGCILTLSIICSAGAGKTDRRAWAGSRVSPGLSGCMWDTISMNKIKQCPVRTPCVFLFLYVLTVTSRLPSVF